MLKRSPNHIYLTTLCVKCGKTFTQNRHRMMYCSTECRLQDYKKRVRRKYQQVDKLIEEDLMGEAVELPTHEYQKENWTDTMSQFFPTPRGFVRPKNPSFEEWRRKTYGE